MKRSKAILVALTASVVGFALGFVLGRVTARIRPYYAKEENRNRMGTGLIRIAITASAFLLGFYCAWQLTMKPEREYIEARELPNYYAQPQLILPTDPPKGEKGNYIGPLKFLDEIPALGAKRGKPKSHR